MTSRSPFIQPLLAIVLLAGGFLSGMAVTIVKTASTMRQLATELDRAQKRMRELDQVATVSADDLNSRKSVVIGRLGRPLETMLTIRGTWKQSRMEKQKDYEWFFYVTNVNGKAFDEPVTFHRSLVHVKFSRDSEEFGSREDGPMPVTEESWEIRAYETGGFTGNPRGTGSGGFRHAAPAWWRNFQTGLHGIIQSRSGDVSGRR